MHLPHSLRVLLAALLATAIGIASTAMGDDPAVKDQPTNAAPEDNPYVPRDDLSTLELFELIKHNQDLPKSLQAQPGFADALVICADRIMAGKPDETMRAFAMRAKMDGFQRISIWSEEETKRQDGQKKLVELATQCLRDEDKLVTHWANFYLLEDKVLAAEKLEPEKLPAVLDEVRKFVKDEKLDNRHVRLASSTVKLINKVPSDDEADKAYREFGRIFSASTDDELHRYGDRIAAGIPRRLSDLKGQPIVITGTLYDGEKFDIATWKGHVVLVDFWATWSGPSRALLPELEKLHDKYAASEFKIIGINLDEDRDDLKSFLEETPLPWPNIVEAESPPDSQTSKKYGIAAVPKLLLLDKEGKLVATDLQGKQLAAKIEELLAKK